ncbi:glycosyltransferase family 2 protein [Pseudophaeobacter sp.]|uniref:glycosyltransferase family 2 protein n=1 Tax=Pseudophaeobacter sp. TaxID=1971739 RepID=UPI0032978D2B
MAEATDQSSVRWGVVSTIKAPAEAILNFAAYHLEAGAHRLFIYLDAPCPEARPLLKAHPKIRIFDCTDESWQQRRKKTGKPEKHQARQSLNATRAYRRQADDLDWLAHIDVDEFLWAERPIGQILAELPDATLCSRARPIEALAGDGTGFKGYIPKGPDQGATLGRLYPRHGAHVKGGFLSHIQGKIFMRTGLPNVSLRIHNAFQKHHTTPPETVENPGLQELTEVDLCHFHAPNWQHWLAHYRFRLQRGSYRSELSPARPREKGGISVHELLTAIEAEEGEEGLRVFYDEVCRDTPDLRQRLAAEGLLRIRDLNLAQTRRKYFPNFP